MKDPTVDHQPQVSEAGQSTIPHDEVKTGGTESGFSGMPPAAGAGQPGVPHGYELIGELGRGGMGVVYRARDLALDREVAVKLLQPHLGPETPAAQRFLDEARITGQLQHPGIPAVYQVGASPDGRPFLAMKLIKGRTLEELLRDGAEIDPAAVFEAVAQAVGFAHAHGVVHRDLKPSNIMVGSFGEIQVMDWGLAKVLTAAQPETPAADPGETVGQTEVHTGRDSETPLTQQGSMLGTPAYMAPEQAVGEIDKVDRRSDVFGLGAVLCSMLTGRAPYTATGEHSVRVMAMRGLTGEAFARLDACGADPDMVALCKRCLAFEPDHRPATADAVASAVSRLRRDAEERARRAELDRVRLKGERATAAARVAERRKRRNLQLVAAATVAAVVVAGLAVVLAVQRRANTDLEGINAELGTKNEELTAANGRAEARLGLALDAVGQYRAAIADNPTLRDEAQYDELRRSLLTPPIEFCQRLSDDLRADSGSDPAAKARLATVLLELGNLHSSVGRTADALATTTEADELLTAEGDPADLTLAGRVLLRKGIQQDHLLDGPAALMTFQRAEDLLTKAVRAEGDDATPLLLLAQVLLSRAYTLSRENENDRALAEAAEAASKVAEAARLAPNDPEADRTAYAIADLRATVSVRQQKFEDALGSIEEGLVAVDRYTRKSDTADAGLVYRANLLALAASVYDRTGESDAQGKAWEEVVEIRRTLRDRKRSNTGYRQQLAEALTNLGFYRAETNQVEPALALAHEARQLMEDLRRADPSDTSFIEFLSRTWNLEGNAHYQAGRRADAIAAFREVSRFEEERAARTRGEDLIAEADLAGNEYNLGVMLSDEGRREEAMTSYGRSLEIRRQLARDHPDRPEFRLFVAFTLGNMGKTTCTDDPATAERYFREAVEILADLVERFPKASAARDGLARNRGNLAETLRMLEKPEEALDILAETAEVLAGSVADRPKEVQPRFDLTGTVLTQAKVLIDLDRPSEAGERFRLAKETLEPLLEAGPPWKAVEHLATVCELWAELPEGHAPTAELTELCGRAIELSIRFSQSQPDDVREKLGVILIALDRISARPDGCPYVTMARWYERAFAAGVDLSAHKFGAARAAIRASRGEGSDAPTDPAERAAWRAKALAWLREELTALAAQSGSDNDDERLAAAAELEGWLIDPAFPEFRRIPWRIGLSGKEQADWDALGKEVERAISSARGPREVGKGTTPPRDFPSTRQWPTQSGWVGPDRSDEENASASDRESPLIAASP